MKVIINCAPENLEAAFALVREQTEGDWQRRYDKPGWGWFFPLGNARAFVRGVKGGVSVTEKKP